MATWIKIDEGKYAQVADPLVQRVVTLEELEQQLKQLREAGAELPPVEAIVADYIARNALSSIMQQASELELLIDELRNLE